jgi:Trk K+ transport system NAD-binding subunit
VSGYTWFFIRLAIIVGGIFGLYQLIIRSNVGQRILDWLQRPVMNRILREAPAVEEIFHVEKDWAISLVMMKGSSKSIGLSVADITAQGDIEILGIDRAGIYLTRPNWDEKIVEGDRLLVYANRKSVKHILD